MFVAQTQRTDLVFRAIDVDEGHGDLVRLLTRTGQQAKRLTGVRQRAFAVAAVLGKRRRIQRLVIGPAGRPNVDLAKLSVGKAQALIPDQVLVARKIRGHAAAAQKTA